METDNLFINQVFCAECSEFLKNIPDNSIDLTITSPPYSDLRTYNGYVFNFKDIANQLFRITVNGGVCVWIVGDAVIDGSESGVSFEQALYFKEIGFRLHDTMIYQKHNFSNPSSNRYHQIFEYMFVLSKGKPKTFNPINDRKNVYAGKIGCFGKNTVRQPDGSFKEREKKVNSEFGKRYNIWRVITENHKNDHPAVFPLKLASDMIYSWSNENDIVLDPMCGGGNALLAAKNLNRKYIGIDISSEYVELTKNKLK